MLWNCLTGWDCQNNMKLQKIVVRTVKHQRFKPKSQSSGDRSHHSAAALIQGDGFLYKPAYCHTSKSKPIIPEGKLCSDTLLANTHVHMFVSLKTSMLVLVCPSGPAKV